MSRQPIGLVEKEEIDSFLGNPGTELLNLLVRSMDKDQLNLKLLKLAKSVLKEEEENPLRFPTAWRGYDEDMEMMFAKW